MQLPAAYIRTSDDVLRERSNAAFVRALAEQFDGAHSDRSLAEDVLLARRTPLYIGNEQASLATLRLITNHVLWFGREFLLRVGEN